ncbi:MAG: replication-relaxation family protein [Actinomycetota bacterium]
MTRSAYLTKARLSELRSILDSLDNDILDTVGRFRLVNGNQLTHLFTDGTPASVRAMQRRTRRLVEWQVLDRLERRVGGVRAGSAGYIYRLGTAGRKLREIDGRPASREPGSRFVAHTLEITEVYVQLIHLHKTAQLRLVRFDPEPIAWRTWTGPSGEKNSLRPDGFCIVERDRTRSFWFIEIDMATEVSSTILRKMNRYIAYLETGIEQQKLSGVFPRVLWHAPGLPQRSHTLATIARSARGPNGLHVTSGLTDGVRGPPAAA